MDSGIHGVLHLIEVGNLVNQGLVVDATNMRIERAKQDRDVRAHRVHSTLTKVIELRKALRWDIDSRRGSILHLFITTLYRVGTSLSRIIKRCRIKELGTTCSLADDEEDTNT